MNSEHTYTTFCPLDSEPNLVPASEPDDDAWDVFLPDGDGDALPEEGDFWGIAGDDWDARP